MVRYLARRIRPPRALELEVCPMESRKGVACVVDARAARSGRAFAFSAEGARLSDGLELVRQVARDALDHVRHVAQPVVSKVQASSSPLAHRSPFRGRGALERAGTLWALHVGRRHDCGDCANPSTFQSPARGPVVVNAASRYQGTNCTRGVTPFWNWPVTPVSIAGPFGLPQ